MLSFLATLLRRHGIINIQQQKLVQIEQITSLESNIRADEAQLQAFQRKGVRANDPRMVQLRTETSAMKELLSELETGSSHLAVIPQNRFPSVAATLADLELEVAIDNTILSALCQQYETVRLQVIGASKSFEVVEPPRVPEVKSGPDRVRFSIVAVAVCRKPPSGYPQRTSTASATTRPTPWVLTIDGMSALTID